MLDNKTIAVVVPTFNEEKLIIKVIETMPDIVDRIYLVDDCSTDKTVEIVKQYIKGSQIKKRLTIISHNKNMGVGAAIVTGYKKAIDDNVDIAAVMAGDAQMNPNDLEHILLPIVEDKADYVKGNRLFTGEAWTLIPKHRYLGNAFLSLFTKIASGYWNVADSQTGYTAISIKTMRLLPLNDLYTRYGYPNHLLVMLNIFEQRVCDVPIQPIYNIGEKSGIRLHRDIPVLIKLLLSCFFWRLKQKYIIRNFHPLILFYTAGICLFPFGILLGLYLVFYRIFIGQVAETSAMLAMFLSFSGLQFLLFAMWFDSEQNRSLNVH